LAAVIGCGQSGNSGGGNVGASGQTGNGAGGSAGGTVVGGGGASIGGAGTVAGSSGTVAGGGAPGSGGTAGAANAGAGGAVVGGAGLGSGGAAGGGAPTGTPTVQDFHLTARPWTPLNFPKDRYLVNAEAAVRVMKTYQAPDGGIIDPVEKMEFQYGTPFYVYAGAALLANGKAMDLKDSIMLAMNHVAGQIGACATGDHATIIPNDHGNFFLAPMAGAYVLLKPMVPQATADMWKTQLGTPIGKVINAANFNNWITYAMKGEWLRAQAGLVTTAQANAYIDYSWTGGAQGSQPANSPPQVTRVHDANLEFYHDLTSDPDTYAYESVARMNTEAILASGYTGPSKATMEPFVVTGANTAVKVQDPTGQGAANGRSGDHSWNDVVPLNVYERLANRYKMAGDEERAGRFRRSAMLALRGLDRWRRPDGSYSTTKNQFDFNLRVHYADYSGRVQYNGNMEYHQAEAFYLHRDDITEWPTWNEIGGYAFQTDDAFAGAFVNAGGMHMQIALRGQTALAYAIYWTALGVSRFSRVDWDSRLGPSDGIRDEKTGAGMSFAPEFMSGGKWTRLAAIPDQYRADFSTTFIHPLLVKFALDYHPLPGKTGPTFHEDFVVTPDGVLTTLTSSAAAGQWGITWPMLMNDGAGPLVINIANNNLASTRFSAGTDEQNYIAVGGASTLTTEDVVRSGYGDLEAVRYVATGAAANSTFVYPRNAGQPDGATVRDSFMKTATGFKTVLGRVGGNMYVGLTSAGGEGTSLDIDGDGTPDVTFDQSCKFVLQLAAGKIIAVETDHAVKLTRGTNAPITVTPYVPVRF
jgi:hypothetical protein